MDCGGGHTTKIDALYILFYGLFKAINRCRSLKSCKIDKNEHHPKKRRCDHCEYWLRIYLECWQLVTMWARPKITFFTTASAKNCKKKLNNVYNWVCTNILMKSVQICEFYDFCCFFLSKSSVSGISCLKNIYFYM